MAPRNVRKRLVFQVGKAAEAVDKVLDHLMCADVLGHGGTVSAKGKYLPMVPAEADPKMQGHPLLNQYLPMLTMLCASLKEALLKLKAQL